MARPRLVLLSLGLLLLAALTTGLWIAEDWPPPLLLLEHGRLPAGGRTGRTTNLCGIPFEEMSAGYYRMGDHVGCEEGDPLGRLCAPLGLPEGARVLESR